MIKCERFDLKIDANEVINKKVEKAAELMAQLSAG